MQQVFNMDAQQPRRKQSNSARERQTARQRKHQTMATKIEEPQPKNTTGRFSLPFGESTRWQQFIELAKIIAQDARWHITHNPIVMRGAAGIVIGIFGLLMVSYLLSGKIFPGIQSVGVGLAGLSQEDAAEKLATAWMDEIKIDLVIDGETVQSIHPTDLGLRINAAETAKQARSAGLTGIPFGNEIVPIVDFDYLTAQTYLLDMTETLNEVPFNAGYEWRSGQIVGMDGTNGQSLDVTLTLDQLGLDIAQIVQRGQLDLLMTTLRPDVTDPTPFLDEAQALASQPLSLLGYDPFYNQHFTWPIEPEIFVGWLEAGPTSLTLREEAFLPYIDALNATLNTEGDNLRYLSPDETMESLRGALSQRQSEVNFRVRYRPTTYEVQSGDSGYEIARKTGIPYYLIEQINNGRDMNVLSPGDLIQIPSRDVTMQFDPLPNKRIVVNLDTQWMVAYEDGQEVLSWSISSGVSNAPTSPGIFQILSHDEKAYGSSNSLCDSAGVVCGQWEMNWFMGIYEVVPGLVNGFHGGVLLPNGNYLGGGNVGAPYTFGCVMSRDEQALALYDWAEIGTVVEIIASEYPPISDLGQLAATHSSS